MVWKIEKQQPLDCTGSCSHFRTEPQLLLVRSSAARSAMAPKTAAAPCSASAADAALPSGAAAAASSSSSSGSGGIAALAASGAVRAKQVSADIEELLRAQKRAREEKKKLQNDLKNARRRRSRLTKRARQLSTEDLLTVVALRESERAARSRDATPAPLADATLEDIFDGADAEDRGAAAASEDEDAALREERVSTDDRQ